jgi:hypothetical protein
MPSATAARLAESIRATIKELRAACAEVDEAAAGRAPEGRWTPREILSHLAGPEGPGLVAMFRRLLDEDEPRIDLVPEQTYMTGERSAMPFALLVDKAAQKYEAVARFAEERSEEQLARTAHVPVLAKSPMGERPSLAALLGGFGQYHVAMHIAHLRDVLAGKPAA